MVFYLNFCFVILYLWLKLLFEYFTFLYWLGNAVVIAANWVNQTHVSNFEWNEELLLHIGWRPKKWNFLTTSLNHETYKQRVFNNNLMYFMMYFITVMCVEGRCWWVCSNWEGIVQFHYRQKKTRFLEQKNDDKLICLTIYNLIIWSRSYFLIYVQLSFIPTWLDGRV